MEVKIVLFVLLFAVQALSEVTKEPGYEATKIVVKKAGGTTSTTLQSDESPSATLNQAAFENTFSSDRARSIGQAVRRGPAPAATTVETTTVGSPCLVKNQTGLTACSTNMWIKGDNGDRTLVDLSNMNQQEAESLFLNKRKIEDISIRLSKSTVVDFAFPNLVAWTAAKEEDIVIADNLELSVINFPKMKDLIVSKKLVVSRNPKLLKIWFWKYGKEALAINLFEVTKNPSLDDLETPSEQSKIDAVVRGNKLLKLNSTFWQNSHAVHHNKSECGFWEPISDFKELAGCTEIWDEVEFAANVTGNASSVTIEKIDGNLKIVGTDLKNLTFLAKDIVITGIVEFKDNFEMPGDMTFDYRDSHGDSKQALVCLTTTTTTITTTPGPSTTSNPKDKKPKSRNQEIVDAWLTDLVETHCMDEDGSTLKTTPESLGCFLVKVIVGVLIMMFTLMGCCSLYFMKRNEEALVELADLERIFPNRRLCTF